LAWQPLKPARSEAAPLLQSIPDDQRWIVERDQALAMLTASSGRHGSATLGYPAYEAPAIDDDLAANTQAAELDDMNSALTDHVWSAWRREM
jgi:hypothetical protein